MVLNFKLPKWSLLHWSLVLHYSFLASYIACLVFFDFFLSCNHFIIPLGRVLFVWGFWLRVYYACLQFLSQNLINNTSSWSDSNDFGLELILGLFSLLSLFIYFTFCQNISLFFFVFIALLIDFIVSVLRYSTTLMIQEMNLSLFVWWLCHSLKSYFLIQTWFFL